jgi:phosphoglucomutase
MVSLKKTVRRKSNAARHEKSKTRFLILSLEAPNKIGVRLEGTRQTYRMHANGFYEMAVALHEAEIEKRAKQIVKADGLKLRSARAKARRELQERLR